MDQDRIILQITPQTWVRSTKGDKILFRIPEDCRKLKGKKPCHKFRKTGECPHILSKGGRTRKRRLERYNQYKVDLHELATKMRFEMPVCGWSLYFYIPMPKRWSNKKKILMAGQMHMKKPDESNLLKCFEDSLYLKDEVIAQMSGLGKFWVDQPQGYIEVLLNQPIYNPLNVKFIDQEALKLAPKRKWVKKEDKPDLRRRKIQRIILVPQEELFNREDKIK